MIKGYDSWKLSNSQEGEKVFAECEHCGGEIYVGDEYLGVSLGVIIHTDCFDEFALAVLDPRSKIAE